MSADIADLPFDAAAPAPLHPLPDDAVGARWRDCLRWAYHEREGRTGLCPACESVVREQAENDPVALLVDMAREIALQRRPTLTELNHEVVLLRDGYHQHLVAEHGYSDQRAADIAYKQDLRLRW